MTDTDRLYRDLSDALEAERDARRDTPEYRQARLILDEAMRNLRRELDHLIKHYEEW